MNKKILRILIFLLIITGLLAYGIKSGPLRLGRRVEASGNLIIDYGQAVPGEPIFAISDFKPGDCTSKSVKVKNNGSKARVVGVRSENITNSLLSNALFVVIRKNSTPFYGEGSPGGPKTLGDFFNESQGFFGLILGIINPGEEISYDFEVCFDQEAGNEYQEMEVVFDLTFGTVTEIPDECKDIPLTGSLILGTDGGEVLIGTNANDYIFGFEGNDILLSLNGDDCAVGGEGNDWIIDSNGNDVFFGNGGRDVIFGSNGDDLLLGGPGNDRIRGGNGNDTVYGEEGNDRLWGGSGDDALIGGAGLDSARGGLGVDTCDAENEAGCEL